MSVFEKLNCVTLDELAGQLKIPRIVFSKLILKGMSYLYSKAPNPYYPQGQLILFKSSSVMRRVPLVSIFMTSFILSTNMTI